MTVASEDAACDYSCFLIQKFDDAELCIENTTNDSIILNTVLKIYTI